MTPDQTRAYIEAAAPEYGIDPAIAFSLAELTSYSPKWSSPTRSGILQLPNQYIDDLAAYQKNPEAQIDAGLMMLAKQKESSPSDFAMLADYTGNPATALKALLRTMKYRNQPITPDELNQTVQELGLDLDPIAEARKAGVRVEEAAPVQQAEQMSQGQPQNLQQMPQQGEQPAPQAPEPDPMDMVVTSTAKEKKRRIDAAFGDNTVDGDIPEDLIAYVKGLI